MPHGKALRSEGGVKMTFLPAMDDLCALISFVLNRSYMSTTSSILQRAICGLLFVHSSERYPAACGGASGNEDCTTAEKIGSLENAEAKCCADPLCAGFSWPKNGKGAMCFKLNQGCYTVRSMRISHVCISCASSHGDISQKHLPNY